MIQQKISGTVYGVVLNDRASLQKIGSLEGAPYKGAPKAPALYIKPANTRTGRGAVVRLPSQEESVEVGATVGLILGRAAGRLEREHALDAVAGLVLAADLSLPHASYYRPAIREKCFDGSLPLGTVQPLVPLDTIVLTTVIDGELAEERSLADLVRDPARLLADVTEFMTLAAGDVLLVGVTYQAPRARPGSRVTISATGLGSLDFSIAAQGTQP
ncbi:MAG TPA: fumarylacetoacetate hydrolase family protein [Rhodocyclaceae bacterium]|nr:fumarylacetoacetate hydrolase family protein [Rhodocyclaceae bacterium]